MSSEIRPNNENNQQPSQSTNDNNRLLAQDEISTSSNLPSPENDKVEQEASSLLSSMFGLIKESISSSYHKPPPLQIEDVNVLFYDVFLILNLSMSISFWVTHRMDVQYLGVSISEGSLFCLLWIISGLYYGAFLYSAVDGHYGSTSDQGGPRAAGLLGLHTFIGTCNLRILSALGMAVVEHREVGSMPGEDLIPLEIAFGLVLMSIWRALHSSFTPRI